ncbi:hypothetical protein PYCC9005_000689 [Savitreella phatthalungensis]
MPRIRKRAVLVAAIIFFLIVCLNRASGAKSFLLVRTWHFRWAMHDTFAAIGLASILSKQPMLQLVGQDSYEVVFEFRVKSKLPPEAGIRFRTYGVQSAEDRACSSSIDPETQAIVYRCPLELHSDAQGLTLRIITPNWQSSEYHISVPLPASIVNEPGHYGVRIALVGDNQFAATQFTKLLHSLRSWRPALLVHLGDAVQQADDSRAWSTDFWNPIAWAGLLSSPIVLLAGNHDTPSLYSPAKSYGSFTLAGGRLFVLIVNAQTPDTHSQRAHIAAAFDSPDARKAHRRIVLTHMSPFIEYWDPVSWVDGGEREWNRHVREEYMPLWSVPSDPTTDVRHFKPADLVVSGHQHNYQRLSLADTHYITVGGGGGTLDYDRVCDWSTEGDLATCVGEEENARDGNEASWRILGMPHAVKTVVRYHYAILDIQHSVYDDTDPAEERLPGHGAAREHLSITWTAYDADGGPIDMLVL